MPAQITPPKYFKWKMVSFLYLCERSFLMQILQCLLIVLQVHYWMSQWMSICHIKYLNITSTMYYIVGCLARLPSRIGTYTSVHHLFVRMWWKRILSLEHHVHALFKPWGATQFRVLEPSLCGIPVHPELKSQGLFSRELERISHLWAMPKRKVCILWWGCATGIPDAVECVLFARRWSRCC